ncbi:MAG: hypothetical protein HRT61_21570 [Ekhidna sp.]|nr:hypothetical protein [Ekhidna sp.]
MEDWNFGISTLIGLGYVFYFLNLGIQSKPYDRNYTKLFNKSYFIVQLGITVAIAIFGTYRILNVDAREVFYLSPLTFLIFFAIFNKISLLSTGRNILIATGWDRIPNGNKFTSRMNFFLLFFLTILIPGLLMNFLNIGQLMP